MSVPHPNPLSGEDYSAVELSPDDLSVIILDQRGLPEREEYLTLRTSSEVAEAIRGMAVRWVRYYWSVACVLSALLCRNGVRCVA